MASNQPTTSQLAKGTILQGKSYNYEVVKALGEGSFGITYLANLKIKGDLGTIDGGMKVALKEFFMHDINGREEASVTTSSSDGVYDLYKRKFVKEALALSRVKHPNVVKVVECFDANNTVYYAMEFLTGGSLDDKIFDDGNLTEAEALKYFSQIASALSYLHSQNMLHLDLKPSNIMLRDPDTIALIDFGLAKQFDASGSPESSTTIGGGTPGYAPLEQATYNGDNKDGLPVTMDVYALGATLFKMLTGQLAPVASDILNDGFPEEELVERNINPEIIAVVRKAMEPLRKNRYKSVGEMYRALRPLIPSEQRRKMFDNTADIKVVGKPDEKADNNTGSNRTGANNTGSNRTGGSNTGSNRTGGSHNVDGGTIVVLPTDAESGNNTGGNSNSNRNNNNSNRNNNSNSNRNNSGSNRTGGNNTGGSKNNTGGSAPAGGSNNGGAGGGQTVMIGQEEEKPKGSKKTMGIVVVAALVVIGVVLAFLFMPKGEDKDSSKAEETTVVTQPAPDEGGDTAGPDEGGAAAGPDEGADQGGETTGLGQGTETTGPAKGGEATGPDTGGNGGGAGTENPEPPKNTQSVFGGAAVYDPVARTITFTKPYTLDLHDFDGGKVEIPAGAVLEKVQVVSGYLRQGVLNGRLIKGLKNKL